ncbi:MAG: 2-oxoacid:acceptor oxidoreductase family protein [Candidatus Omnitrophota bacterium]|nr:MAG: 2-oxoacid:acceptor oxidoreductase family protein [Candidatus Omnitrophota bacterium]
MKEIKIFARAGQGAITTAAILGEALFYENKYAYAFPHFGAARMGAPMNAFLRFDDKPIRLRSKVYIPDYIIVVDPTLIESEECFSNLKKGAKAVVAVRESTKIPSVTDVEIHTLPAERIAQDIIGRPFANTVLLGAFSKVTSEIKIDSILEAVGKRFKAKPGILEKNLDAVKKGYESV